MPDVETDAQVVRAGMDSLAWLLNNAHNHDLPSWDGLVKAAREDRSTALVSLDRILAELAQVKAELDDAQIWFKRERQDAAELRIDNTRLREALEEIVASITWDHHELKDIARAALDRGTAAPTTQEDRQ